MTTSLKDSQLLKFHPGTLHDVRKEHNLHEPGMMDQAIDTLQDWIQKQQHFTKKDFPRAYLERIIIAAKGSTEKAKKRMDRLCTMRTILPHFFDRFNVKTDIPAIPMKNTLMPELTEDNYRLHVVRMKGSLKSEIFLDTYRFCMIFFEYLKQHDYASGEYLILDAREISIAEFLTNCNPFELKNMLSLYTDAFGFRVKGIYLISPSKAVDALATLFKQILSAKLGDRIRVFPNPEALHEHLPRRLLPKELGGDEKCNDELYEDWMEELSKKEHVAFVKEMSQARTDETLRLSDKYNEEYHGMPGSFKILNVD